MMRLFGWFLLVGILVGILVGACGRGAEPTSVATSVPTVAVVGASAELDESSVITIVAMGDSLTEGLGVDPDDAYPAQLERKLLADGYNIRVVNAGISGETSSGALSRAEWVLSQKPELLILETGPNDGLRGIDPKVTAENIDAMLTLFHERDVMVVLAGMQIVQNMGADYVEEFRAIYPAAAETHDVILIPFFWMVLGETWHSTSLTKFIQPQKDTPWSLT